MPHCGDLCGRPDEGKVPRMRCIVVTTDLSPESERALLPAAQLADDLSLPITLLAVVEEVPFEPTAGGMAAPVVDWQQISAEWRKRVEAMAKGIQAKLPVRGVVLEAADVPHAIVDFAHNEGAAYIAMATHGRRGLRRLMMGSVAEGVLRQAHVPVLLYPPPVVPPS